MARGRVVGALEVMGPTHLQVVAVFKDANPLEESEI